MPARKIHICAAGRNLFWIPYSQGAFNFRSCPDYSWIFLTADLLCICHWA